MVNSTGATANAKLFQSPPLRTSRAYSGSNEPNLCTSGISVPPSSTTGPERSYEDSLGDKEIAPSAHTIAHKDVLTKALRVAERADKVFGIKTALINSPRTKALGFEREMREGAKEVNKEGSRDESALASGIAGVSSSDLGQKGKNLNLQKLKKKEKI